VRRLGLSGPGRLPARARRLRAVRRRPPVAPAVPASRDEVAVANLNLVRHVVRRYAGTGLDAEDLFQVGCIGLLKAVERFDPARGTRFSTYAVPLILGEIQRYLRDAAPAGLGRGAHRIAAQARAAEDRLAALWHRAPTVGEVAAAVGVSPAELLLALEASRRPASLDGAPAEGGEGGHPLRERLAAPRGLDVDAATLRALLSRLPERERRILALRYFRDRSQAEVGALLGLSQPQISRLERQALDRLRRAWAGERREPPAGLPASPPGP
jgi:RNA polymerase sporulation-specific sigma factor